MTVSSTVSLSLSFHNKTLYAPFLSVHVLHIPSISFLSN
jgi:hypothetical protein